MQTIEKTYRTYKTPLILLMKSLCVGVLVGFIISLYRIVLQNAETESLKIYERIKGNFLQILVWFLILIALALFIGFLSKKFPLIGGSGIPQIKGIMMGAIQNRWFSTLVAKFGGGALAIIAGLSLGREGPSIQMGACIADGFGHAVKSTPTERKSLIAAGASAGLSAAFGAPLAAVLFSVEEIFGYVSPISLLTTMTSAVSSQVVSAYIFGLRPVFDFEATSQMELSYYGMLILLGILVGLGGSFYNWFLLTTQKQFNRLPFTKTIAKPIPAFILTGILGLVFPVVLGGGHIALETLTLQSSVSSLLLILIVKFLFSMVSFQSGSPGGIFFPLLSMGGILGGIFALISIHYFSLPTVFFNSIIVYAMAGYFTAIVRAPITGIILLLEMTGSLAQLLPFTVVCLVSYMVATVTKTEPIYDALLENLLITHREKADPKEEKEKIIFRVFVEHGAPIIGHTVQELPFSQNALLVTIERNGKEITPKGETLIQANDVLLILCDEKEQLLLYQDFQILTKNSIN